MTKNIAVIRGDGIGPEIVNEALRVLDKIAELYGHTFHYTDVDMGGCAIDKWGDPLPQEMLDKCVASDSVLLGAVGGDKWNDVPGPKRPEKGLLRLRAGMGVYSNNRPAKIWPQLSDASPLKKSIVEKGIDFIIVRELIGGIYFGEHKTDDADGQPVATDIMKYSEAEIERIGRIGFETARKRNHRLCSVEKSNVLDTSRLWKKVMHRLAEEYTDVELTDIAGQDLANPIGTILSAAMMLRYSFDMAKEADAVEHAVSKYLDAGYRTADIMEDGMTKVGCKKCGDLILEYLTKE